jgi:hypothetical protein
MDDIVGQLIIICMIDIDGELVVIDVNKNGLCGKM